MERLMVVNTFQKSIDALKNTECSQKEKITLFTQITDCIHSSTLRANASYLNHVSTAISILLMFCEELDSDVRISAEENLNKIIRFLSTSHIVRIQYDLFHEIKRNGNERSLRIALNIFAHYMHLINQRKVKPYALNLLPCILAISHRKEQQLIETLATFVQKFCKYLQIGLNENEVFNLIEIFVKDATGTECSVKRRCSASNVMAMIENARRPDVMSKHALTICLGMLIGDFTMNTIIGAMGFLRVLLPKMLSFDRIDIQVIHKVIEIYEICLHLLNEKNHSIINASLECISVILSNTPPTLSDYLINANMKHMDVLCKRKSLKNQIFRRKSSTTSSEQLETRSHLFATPKATPTRKCANTSAVIEHDLLNETHIPFDERSLLASSDVETDSLRANDTDGERSFDSPTRTPILKSKVPKDGDSLKASKSTDSVGSFFNTILSHSNTDTVTKFFRVGSTSQQTPEHVSRQQSTEQQHTDSDNVSVHSGNSITSFNSQNSSALGTFDIVNKTDDSIPEIEILNDHEIAAIKLENDAEQFKADDADATLDITINQSIHVDRKDISIGSIRDQPLLYYTVRLIASKFLLYGEPSQLIDDINVRISIKNTSLIVISHCVDLCANILTVQLQKIDTFHGYELHDEHPSDSDDDSMSSNAAAVSTPMKNCTISDAGDQLNIKDDHFGENSKGASTYFDFCSTLSKSADNVLFENLYASGNNRSKKTNQLNSDLTDLLSRSEIIGSKSTLTDDTRTNLNVDLKELESCAYRQSNDSINLRSSQQLIEDLLLYWNHSDPVLRTNIQLMIGNFIANVLRNADSIDAFLAINDTTANDFQLLNFNVLFSILLKGLTDNIHSVVKQSMSSLEKVLSILLDHRKDWFLSRINSIGAAKRPPSTLTLECIAFDGPIQLLHKIFDTLLLVFDNKYWVVQKRYCRFIATIDYGALSEIIGCDSTEAYRNQFVSHIYSMLSEADLRIRTEALNAVSEYITLQASRCVTHTQIADTDLIMEFIGNALAQDVPYQLQTASRPFRFAFDANEKQAIEQSLGKCLFDLTNLMLELESREQLLGVTKCVAKLIETFNPIQWLDIWLEFNVLEVSLALLTTNHNTGTDLNCQCDLITICVNILAAVALKNNTESVSSNMKTNTTTLMSHIMKILNIYWHILSDKRPVFIPKSRKSDIFANSKEIQLINSHSYFGNDYFYLKIYKMLRIIYENFKITVSSDIDAKLFGLMETCLSALALLLEIVEFTSTSELTTFVNEMLIYIRAMVIHVPERSVVCIKQLIKLMFSMNYRNRKLQNNLYDLRRMHEPTEMFEYFECFKAIVTAPAKRPTEATPSKSNTLINFLASTPEKAAKSIEAGNIKIFEPLVIQCLKLFTKSGSAVQATILNMLCHVLQLKVNYCLLDAKGIFIGLIMKLIESIEMGNIRDSHIVTPNIITFLFHLARQRDNPQMTIPQIINITDNLLANSITKNGSIEALCQLANEIYFPTSVQDPDNIAKSPINEREIYTQKEVVFSMLLKFIDATAVKKTICVILMKHVQSLGEINREICESLLGVFDDKKPIIQCLVDYWCLRKMAERMRATFVGEKAYMTRLKTRFLLHREMNFVDDLAIKTIILNGVPDVVNIFFESTDSFGHQRSPHELHFIDYIYQTLNHFTTFNYSDNNNFFEMSVDKSLQYLRIFTDYLNALSNAWILHSANQTADNGNNILNENLVDNVMSFVGKLSALQHPSTIELNERFCGAKAMLVRTLFSFISVFCGKTVLYDALKANQNDKEKRNPMAVRHLLETLSATLETSPEIDFILKNHFTKMLSIDPAFIVNASNQRNKLEAILNKLAALSTDTASNEEILWIFLEAIENADIEALSIGLKFLSAQIFDVKKLYYTQSPTLRRAFGILNEKLQSFVPTDDANPQMELYERIVNELLISTLRHFEQYKWHEQYVVVEKSIESIVNVQESKDAKTEPPTIISKEVLQNDEWFLNQVIAAIPSQMNKQSICQLLLEVTSEAKLRKIFEMSACTFDAHLLSELFECSFRHMSTRFMQDCFHHNAHINYLKISPALKLAINVLNDKIDGITPMPQRNMDNCDVYEAHPTQAIDGAIFAVVRTFLKNVIELLSECLVYVEAASIQKFFVDHFFAVINFGRLVQLSFLCVDFITAAIGGNDSISFADVLCACDCICHIINAHALFNPTANYYTDDKCNEFFDALLDVSYRLVYDHLADKLLIERNALTTIREQQNRSARLSDDIELRYAKAIFLGKFIQQHFQANCDANDVVVDQLSPDTTIISLTIAALRSDSFYFFGITPHEIVQSFDWQLNNDAPNRLNRLPCIPIDCLNEAEVIERFVCRINIIGFPSRQYYEEIFMSLLLLMNQENDSFIVDKQEEYQIKNICLMAIIELLLSCKMYPVVGDRFNSRFHHLPRILNPKSDTIGMKKLHNVQCMFMQQPNVFYMPNAERCWTILGVCARSKHINNSIGTHDFRLHQYDLNVVWHAIEGQCPALKSMNIELKNMKHFLEISAIDFNSGIQLTFDVIAQSLEANYIQMLPHITKFCELCENRDQFHWIKNTMIKLQDSVPMDNALSHQYIIYCLCKSYAVLIPSIHDLIHLCTLLNNYLKSSHLFVRVAALNGLLILFESCIKTNTTIGSLSEEVLHLRTIIINYITQHIVNEDHISLYSLEHSILVWTLNFYLIETTSRYVNECNLIANTIIAANNILKKTTNVTLYACIIHGLERIIITRVMTKFCHDKVDRLALDLVKMENEQLSLLALKLLTTCMYIGSIEQLENTERCNGIIQDEPDVIVQSTEKIEILFNRIKLATRPAATVYGNILGQLIHDLIPPRDLLTKVIQELLTTSQPHCTIIAKILYQIFRSAIDSSYLPLLQDWLLCSLPNFAVYPIAKTMWYLTVIFISASINLDLIKIFAQVLADYDSICDTVSYTKLKRQTSATQQPTTPCDAAMLQCYTTRGDCNANRQYMLFVVACRDFYKRLNATQKSTFCDIFAKFNEPNIADMLNAL